MSRTVEIQKFSLTLCLALTFLCIFSVAASALSQVHTLDSGSKNTFSVSSHIATYTPCIKPIIEGNPSTPDNPSTLFVPPSADWPSLGFTGHSDIAHQVAFAEKPKYSLPCQRAPPRIQGHFSSL